MPEQVAKVEALRHSSPAALVAQSSQPGPQCSTTLQAQQVLPVVLLQLGLPQKAGSVHGVGEGVVGHEETEAAWTCRPSPGFLESVQAVAASSASAAAMERVMDGLGVGGRPPILRPRGPGGRIRAHQ